MMSTYLTINLFIPVSGHYQNLINWPFKVILTFIQTADLIFRTMAYTDCSISSSETKPLLIMSVQVV